MQNNVTELTQRLLRSLDSNYNVIDIPEVVDIISLLEKVAITKELLETTRLGKHINELRRKTTNVELSRRAKELLKKWRSMVLPEANGQIKTSPPLQEGLKGSPNKGSPPLQGHSLKPRASPVPPQTKVSPPLIAKNLVSPALPASRLVSPAPPPSGRMLSPGLYNQQQRLPSPGLQAAAQKLVSPRKMVSPGLQTQRVSPKLAQQAQGQRSGISPPLTAGGQQHQQDVNLNQVVQVKSKKRPAKDGAEGGNAKRARINGGMTDLDVSDSNSSFKDVILPTSALKPAELNTKRGDMIVINSDSNSSYSEQRPGGGGGGGGDLLLGEIPKRRGRKKGSKNHKNLIDEAETSFTNKLAVSASRGSSKVKTTQELLASIQNKNSSATTTTVGPGGNLVLKSKEDLEEKAAKLTERVSIIDQKLNANAHRNKNSQKNKFTLSASRPNERVIESGSVINDKSLLRRIREREQRRQREQEEDEEEDEIVVVDDIEPESETTKSESQETESVGVGFEEGTGARSLSEKEALALLPPIDKSVLLEDDDGSEQPHCTCYLKENKPDFSIDEEEVEQPPPFEIIEDPGCLSKSYLEEKYRVRDLSEDKLRRLQEASLPNVNGNWSLGTPRPDSEIVDGLYANVVPNIYERLDKDVKSFSAESRKKYSVSEGKEEDGCSSDIVIKKEVVGNNDIVSEVKKETLEGVEEESKGGDIRTEENNEVFREWYECVDRPSYNGDVLRILPYCVVD